MAVYPGSPLYSLQVVADSTNSAKAQETTARHKNAIWNYLKSVVHQAGNAHTTMNNKLDNVNATGDTSYLYSESPQDPVSDSSGSDSSGSDSSGSDSSGSDKIPRSTVPVNGSSGGASPIFYSEFSPAAKMFGMDQGTAYAEHMANTAHQREVADLKAAGLNPVLGISGSGASTVSGSSASGSYGGSSKSTEISGIGSIIGSIASLGAMLMTKDPSKAVAIGSVTSKAVSGTIDMIENAVKN